MISKIKLTAIIMLVLAGTISATTYHVSKNGNDSNSGLGWVNAWETLDKVNNSVQGSDTVYFATGTWRGELKVVGGSFSDRTCYACSAFANTNGDGTWHFAKIWGSVNYTDSTWTNVTGNIYKTYYDDSNGGLVAQGDSILWLQSSYGDVDEAGEFFVSDGDSLYVYLYDTGSGYNPGNHQIECATDPVVDISAAGLSSNADYVTLWGLEFKYGGQSLIVSAGDSDPYKPDSLFIEHCKISHVASNARNWENPSCIYVNNGGTYKCDYFRVRACSLGYVINYRWGNHGTGITLYSAQYVTIDSCTFFGFFTGACYMNKNAWGWWSEGNAIKYNIFDPTRPAIGVWLYRFTRYDSTYGNIFKGNITGSAYRTNCCPDSGTWGPAGPGHHIYFYNNTIYNAAGFGKYYSESGGCGCYDAYTPQYTEFKYNIIYYPENIPVHNLNADMVAAFEGSEADSNLIVFDDNLYCFNYQKYQIYTTNDIDSSTWVGTYGQDSSSVWVENLSDLGFTDPFNGDFSRPNASGEMNLNYGGKTWTLYGAWQPQDSIPPDPPFIFDQIDSLEAKPDDDSSGAIKLNWIAPGINGDTSRASYYQIRYSTELIDNSTWETDNLHLDILTPTPLPGGEPEECTITGLIEGLNYYVAIKAYNEAGIGSELSNVPDTFASGIMVPTPISTEIDSVNNSVQLTCTTIESYKSINYLFALDSVSVYSSPEFVIDSLADLPSDVATAVFEGLSDDVNYYWRCCAISTDYTDSSAWTPSIEFNLYFGLISSLAESDCLRPTEGEIVPSSRPYFIVRNPLNIYELYFQVDDNDYFNSPVESGSVPPSPGDETRWQLPATDPIEQGITYYWRVSNNNAVWTSPISFSALLEIHPYPNPFRASEGHTNITFANLPQDSSIMISTISGDIILREDNIGPEDWVWDVKNDRGNNLAPGVYLYAINFPSGSSNGKILVIR